MLILFFFLIFNLEISSFHEYVGVPWKFSSLESVSLGKHIEKHDTKELILNKCLWLDINTYLLFTYVGIYIFKDIYVIMHLESHKHLLAKRGREQKRFKKLLYRIKIWDNENFFRWKRNFIPSNFWSVKFLPKSIPIKSYQIFMFKLSVSTHFPLFILY